MIKAVIFDMDGVIIDSEPIHLQIEEQIFFRLGINVTKEEHSSYIGTTSYYMWENIKRKHDLYNTVEELVFIDRTTYMQHLLLRKDELKPIRGIPELIKTLKKHDFKLAIASSSPKNIIEIVAEGLQIENYFNVLVSGDEVDRSKPEPDIFLFAAQQLGVSFSECVVIEDSSNGLKAAKAASMKAVGFINPSSGNQDLSEADLIINSFSDITYEKILTMES